MKVVIPSTACNEKNMVFFTPEARIDRIIKPFGVRRVQISSSKPPMLDYTCGKHVINTCWLKEKKLSKNVDFYPKKQHFSTIFSLLVNACWPHVYNTCNPTLDAWRLFIWTLLTLTCLIIRPILASGGEENHIFSLQAVDGITTFNSYSWAFLL